ncbi:MAG TPA: ATPase [candidate division CPR3 bacterium]|uniref:ATPase n=1 Tax=candidate division CPR3 bacterium TaxID=2268181 RepID=A0A7C1SX52_UNCC3|nr:ATPase [candidate division CPR3 bacterium]
MQITKASGKVEEFSRVKLERSLRRSGATAAEVKAVADVVERKMRTKMATHRLYKLAYSELERIRPKAAAVYSLREAIMELGPEGFLFEQYVGAVLKEYGYTIKRGRMVKGKCVSHEIDLMAEKGNITFIIELKYHNKRGIRSDVKVTMYLYARFLDIHLGHTKESSHKPWLMTNTKFTKSAIAYAECMGVKMTGWRYPSKEGLQDLIEKKGLYPVTVLPSVNRFVRDALTEHSVFFAKDLSVLSSREVQKRFGVNADIAKKLVKESNTLA